MTRFRRLIDRLTRSNQTYIMPTGHGVVFLSGIIVMILAGATYSNNLIYLLAFFLFATFVVSMVQTHHNISKILVEVIAIEDGAVDSWIQIDLKIHQKEKAHRQNLMLKLPETEWSLPSSVQTDYLPPKGQTRCRMPVKAKLRGRFQLPRIRVETKFPLGLFIAWKLLPLEGEVFVYPKPRGKKGISICKIDRGFERGASVKSARGEEADFNEHKAYQLGESARRVDWKLLARKKIKMIKSFEGQNEACYRLVYSERLGEVVEDRLSQLAIWIEEASAKKLVFELWLPHKKLERAVGPQHVRSALRELAQFDERSFG